MKTLLLASGSPRRAEILTQGGFPFVKRTAETDETLPQGIAPADAVKLLAERKGKAVERSADEALLAADTVVAFDGKILGKPKDKEDAFQMLKNLSGRTHSVFTGVYIVSEEKEFLFSVETKVTFFELSDEEIRAYIETEEPMDKAGAYGIQGKGALLVESICGDYLNVVGLPLSKVAKALKEVL